MALKRKFATQDEIPEALRDFYVEKDGAWVLDAEGDAAPGGGAPDKRKLDEMRNHNIELLKQIKEMQAKVDALGDLDPEKVKAAFDALSKTQNTEELELVKSGRLDEVVARRTQAMQSTFQKQMEALNKQREEAAAKEQAARQRFSEVFLAEQIGQAIDKKKLRIRPTAKADLLARAQRTFRPDDSLAKLVPLVDDYGEDGKPYVPETWLDRLVTEAPHLFEDSVGGGAAKPGMPGAKRKISPRGLDPLEFTQAADEVNAGKADWA